MTTKSLYIGNHTHAIYNPAIQAHSHTYNPATYYSASYVYDPIKIGNTKKEEMTVLEKLTAERKEKKERERVEKILKALDSRSLEDAESFAFYTGEGEGLRWHACARNKSGKVFVWSVTDGPQQVSLDDVFSWMIRSDVDTSSIVVFS